MVLSVFGFLVDYDHNPEDLLISEIIQPEKYDICER